MTKLHYRALQNEAKVRFDRLPADVQHGLCALPPCDRQMYVEGEWCQTLFGYFLILAASSICRIHPRLAPKLKLPKTARSH